MKEKEKSRLKKKMSEDEKVNLRQMLRHERPANGEGSKKWLKECSFF
jgi:hypothetical protein